MKINQSTTDYGIFICISGTAPFFREKIKHCVIHENEEAVFSCRVAADPEAQVSWFRNDGILIESSRIIVSKDTF